MWSGTSVSDDCGNHQLRKALLVSTTLIAFAAPQGAFAACQGENTGNVLCDAAHPATAGTLATSFAGATAVNVNAGAAINVSASATVTAAGDLVFNHNDPAGMAGILARNDFGAINVTTNAAILTGGLTALDNSAASTSPITVTANRSITGNVSVQNAGSGTTTVATSAIAGTLNVSGHGANSSVQVNDVVNSGDLPTGGAVVAASLTGSGNATVTTAGAVSGSATSNSWSTLIGSNVTLSSSSAAGQVAFNSNGSVSANGVRLGGGITVTGVQTAISGVAPAVININGSVTTGLRLAIGGGFAFGVNHSQDFSSASASTTLVTNAPINVDTVGGIPVFTANGVGINATGTGVGALSVTNNSTITVTDNGAASGNVTGIKAIFSGNASGTGALAITANGNITIVPGGQGTGISASTAGLGSLSITNGGLLQVFSGFSAVGITASITNAANASALSIHVQNKINAQGTSAANSFGIQARHDGTGDITIDVVSSVATAGTGISATRGGAGNTLITVFGSTGLGSGSVQGSTGIVTSGGSTTLMNFGTIAGSGGTAIQFGGANNILTLAPGAAINGNVLGTGSDTFQLGGPGGAAAFDVSKIGPSAQYRGFNAFNKVGLSTWTLTGASTVVQPWSVQAGTLVVSGSMANSPFSVANGTLSVNGTAGDVTVNSGGILGGNGTVGNTTINGGGTLAPGNSIGLLTVQGNLVFAAAASYMVEVSPANADRVNVTGTATLGGATVNASFAAGTYVNKQYTIVNAAGGVIGTFGSLVNTNLNNFTSSLSYDANNVFLNLKLNFTPPVAMNVNQQNVANALVNFFNSTGGIPMAFGTLTSAGLTQISGELPTASQQTTFDAMNLFLGLLTDPFVAGRGDPVSAGGGASPFAADDREALAYAASGKPRSKGERDAYAAIYRKAPIAPSLEQRWSVWAAGYGGSQTTDGNTVLGSNNTRSSIGGVAVGADYRFSPNTLAGFAIAGGGTSFSVNGLGSGRSDLFQAGAFVRHNNGPAYISAALAYGWQNITTDRTVTIAGADLLHANFNANAYSGRLEGGYRFVTPWLGGIGITPYAAGQFTTFDLPAYAEQAIAGANTFALSYMAKSVTDTRSELGLRSDKSFAMQNGIFTLRGRAAWAHDFNPDRSIGATFQTLPGASFVVNGAAHAADSALVTGSAEMKWLNGFSLAATFEGEFSNVTRSYAGKGVVRYAW
jgi:uncharacterized protein with beta-barrel porin domain